MQSLISVSSQSKLYLHYQSVTVQSVPSHLSLLRVEPLAHIFEYPLIAIRCHIKKRKNNSLWFWNGLNRYNLFTQRDLLWREITCPRRVNFSKAHCNLKNHTLQMFPVRIFHSAFVSILQACWKESWLLNHQHTKYHALEGWHLTGFI